MRGEAAAPEWQQMGKQDGGCLEFFRANGAKSKLRKFDKLCFFSVWGI